jgi:hypothetical protein
LRSTSSAYSRRPRAHFVLDGISIDVVADDGAIVAGIEDRIRPLIRASGGPAHLVFDIRGPGAKLDSLPVPNGTSRRVYDAASGGFDYFDDTDVLFVDHTDALRLRCRPQLGRVDVAIGAPAPGRMLAINPLFTIPLLEVAKRRGLFGLHAACVARDGEGVLIAGPSGAGKSTLTVALVRAGFDFLSDDIVFLRREEGQQGQVRVIAFPDTVDITTDTIAMFSELRDIRDAPLPDGRSKRRVRVEERFGATAVASCSPRALVLVEFASDEKSALVAVPKNDALVSLAPNVLLTDERSSQAHFTSLATLAREVPCYALRSGRDVAATVHLVESLLD